MESLQLEVAEAKPTDVGRRIARLDRKFLKQIGAEPGDVLEINGKKKTCAVAWPAKAEDENRKIIRIESSTRKSAGVSIGSLVTIRKADKVSKASRIILTIIGLDVKKVEPQFIDLIRSRFKHLPVAEGEFLEFRIFGTQVIELKVERAEPTSIAIITDNTDVQILPEALAEKYVFPRVTYEDIGGLHEEIQRVREIVELPLKHPEVFQRLGINPPKGILMYGPPGCGKTLLAKAVANEVGATFLSINGPEIMGKYYGESEERLREVFKEAKEKSPSIIFIDEIDSLAPKRVETGEVERRIVAQLLSLMDGLKDRGDVVVIGATNMPELLDPALRRPGRFDREIEIKMPNKDGRLEILQIHSRGVPLSGDVDVEQIAEITHGYTGADMAALCKEAAMKALRRHFSEILSFKESIPIEVLNKIVVTMEDFMSAYKEMVPTTMREVYVEIPHVRWDNVGGLEEAKKLLREAVEMIINKPEKAKKLGIDPPSGILLYGPPGCGKTLLAKAVATESQVNFISIRGPEVYSKWVGESERAIREVFRKARLAAPSIIFLDEIDSLAPRPELEIGDSGVTRRVVSQLLVEMDGLVPIQNVILIGATNKPEDVDPALLRPGRFDKLIYVPPPDEKTRLSILKVHTGKMLLDPDVDLESIANMTEGFSGADLKMLCNEAGITAYRREGESVKMADFEKALTHMAPSISHEEIAKYTNWRQSMKRFKKPA
ncbi:MAG: CDC48 family AAA ATPase [Thermoproteota archaeon]